MLMRSVSASAENEYTTELPSQMVKTPLPNANSSFQFAASCSNEPNENGPSSSSWLLLLVGARTSQMIGTMKKITNPAIRATMSTREIHCLGVSPERERRTAAVPVRSEVSVNFEQPSAEDEHGGQTERHDEEHE